VITGDRPAVSSRAFRPDGSLNQPQASTRSTISPVNRLDSGITGISTPVSGPSIDKSSAATTKPTVRSPGMGGATLGSSLNGVGGVGGSVSGSEYSPSTAEYPELDTPEQYQTYFGDSAYSQALTDRMIEESNQGMP
jgi:hypothetical protein